MITNFELTSKYTYSMTDSKLIESIKLFNLNELEQLKHFLVSDLFLKGTRKKDAISLFNLIISYYPECNAPALDKERVVEVLLGDKNINKLEKIMSDLLNAIEEYMFNFISQYQLTEIEKQLKIATVYRKRGYSKRGEVQLKNVAEFWSKSPKMSDEVIMLYQKYLEECNHNNHLTFIKKIKIENSLFPSSYKILNYILQVRNLCYKVYTSNKLNDFDLIELEFMEQTNNYIAELRDNVLFQLYLLSVKIFKEVEYLTILDSSYSTFNEILYNNKHKLESDLFLEFLTIERFIFSKKYNFDQNVDTANDVKTIYLNHLREGFLMKDGVISIVIATNLVAFALNQKDADWIANFLNDWGDFIGNKNERTEVLNYFWANYYFLIKDYDKATSLISFEYKNIDNLLFAKRMNIKILYETNNEHLLEYDLNAFKVFVHRIYKKEDILVTIFDFNNNFINLLKQIINLGKKDTINLAKKEQLKLKITETKTAEKEWLLEKIDALGNNT